MNVKEIEEILDEATGEIMDECVLGNIATKISKLPCELCEEKDNVIAEYIKTIEKHLEWLNGIERKLNDNSKT